MFVFGFTLVVLGCFSGLISANRVSGDYDPRNYNWGLSSYCGKAYLYPDVYHFPRRASNCCMNRYICPDVILPGATKYGITNGDAIWSIRRCHCDAEFYKCLTKYQGIDSIQRIRNNFRGTACFDVYHQQCRKRNGKKICKQYFELFSPLSKFPITTKVRGSIGNRCSNMTVVAER